MYPDRAAPHFEGYNKTKQMVRLKYRFRVPIQKDGLKRVRISTQNIGCQAMLLSYQKTIYTLSLIRTRAFK